MTDKEIPRNEAQSNWNFETLKEYVLSRIANFDDRLEGLRELLTERDLRYSEKFIASKEAVITAFASSEKASLKAEQAQESYNVRSNEFRGQLDDQAKTLMPRLETDGRFSSVEDKIYTTGKANTDKIEEVVKKLDSVSSRLTTVEGRGDGNKESKANTNMLYIAVIGGLALIMQFIGLAILFFKLFSKP